MIKQETVTIAASGTTSSAIRMDSYAFAGLICPATMTSTSMTFTVCDSATGTFRALYDADGTQVSITVGSAKATAITGTDGEALSPWAYVKLVCGSSEAAERSIVVVLK